MKRLLFTDYLKKEGLSEVTFLQSEGKRAYCFVGKQIFVVGSRTDINQTLYIVDGGEKGMFLSNNESAKPIQVVGKVLVDAVAVETIN